MHGTLKGIFKKEKKILSEFFFRENGSRMRLPFGMLTPN
jgi:hypothetical protein